MAVGSVFHLVVFIAVGVLILSWGFKYSLLDIVLGVIIFIVASVLYFQWEEKTRKQKATRLKEKAVPSIPERREPDKMQRAPFFSVPPMKLENRSRIAPGMNPKVLTFK